MEYNYTLHTIIPSVDDIKDRTGYDLTLEAGSTEKAKGKIVSLTLKARDYLYSRLTQENRKVLEYLIFKRDDYREAFINYVITYIEATLLNDIDFIYDSNNLPRSVLDAIDGSILSTTRFSRTLYYEAMNSSEVF